MTSPGSHRRPSPRRRASRPRSGAGSRLAASLALVAGAAAVAGLGTYGSFTSSTSAAESVSAGRIELGLANQNQGFNVPATGMVPGDSAQRAVQLTRAAGSETFGSVTLSTSGGGLLANDANGLKMTVEQCSVPWAKVGSTMTLACNGTTSTVLTQRAVPMTGQVLPASTLNAVNGTSAAANLRVTLALPLEAGNNLQGASGTITFTFDATQRTGENR
ncbi:TasA family protein [Nocardioides sp. 31GB23]|uniref:TasA family protein n=1 Tax=Nocardioides sp. 31GB23 TaxID=3156065 RepID=UPI0032AF1F51